MDALRPDALSLSSSGYLFKSLKNREVMNVFDNDAWLGQSVGLRALCQRRRPLPAQSACAIALHQCPYFVCGDHIGIASDRVFHRVGRRAKIQRFGVVHLRCEAED